MQSRVCGPQPWSLASRSPEIAARYLERALLEPCSPELRPALLNRLGVAEARIGQGASIAHLRTSLELTSDPSRRAVRALDLANALLALGSPAEAYDRLESAIEDLEGCDRELGLHLEAQALTIGQIELTLTRRARTRFEQLEPLAGETPGERLVLGALALERRLVGALADEVVDLAERALADGRLLVEQAPDSPIFYHAVAALGGDPRAEQLLSRACQEARGRGSLLGQAIVSSVRAVLLRSSGDVRELEAEAANGLRVSREVGWRLGFPLSIGALLTALVEQGVWPRPRTRCRMRTCKPSCPTSFTSTSCSTSAGACAPRRRGRLKRSSTWRRLAAAKLPSATRCTRSCGEQRRRPSAWSSATTNEHARWRRKPSSSRAIAVADRRGSRCARSGSCTPTSGSNSSRRLSPY